MDNSFENILFLTSFCCMACDGEIASEEVELLRNFSVHEQMFNTLDIKEEFSKCFALLTKLGNDFIKSYFQAIGKISFTDDEKISILDVAVKTILADNKVEYSEIKFFKSLFNAVNIDKNIALEKVPNIEEYWLEDDLSNNRLDYNYFNNSDLSIKTPQDLVIQ